MSGVTEVAVLTGMFGFGVIVGLIIGLVHATRNGGNG